MVLASKNPYNKAFLADRYKAYRHFKSSSVSNPVNAEDRRHEVHLRTLIDAGDLETASKYVNEMIAFCEMEQDKEAAELYREYSRRIASLGNGQGDTVEEEAVVGFYDLP